MHLLDESLKDQNNIIVELDFSRVSHELEQRQESLLNLRVEFRDE